MVFNGTRFYFKKVSKDIVIVHYHGNADTACNNSSLKNFFEEFKTSVIFAEYSGYSDDGKKPSIKLILKDVENIHNFIKKKGFKHVIVFGQSLGSGAASYEAFLGGVDCLILATPFSSISDVAKSKYPIFPVSLLLTENYDNEKWLKKYRGNILILHGNRDSVIPYRFSKKLFNSLKTKNKEYVLIEGKGHNDIWSSPIFIVKVINFISKCVSNFRK